ncbi:MAG: LysR family transcriptional regulator [Pseudohongiella sp.]|nr:LysR family transcriptional regulator [Pseudohongiella sp.]
MNNKLPEMNLKSLECFRAIMQTGSVTAAARQLELTQPGVSRLLRILEVDVGGELFYREKGRLVPTQEAQLLIPEVEIALQSVEHVTELARNLHNANYGELKIVAPPSFSEGLLSSVVSSFIRMYPQVSISLDSHGVETSLKMIALRAVDCGFTKLPIEYPGLVSEPLLEAGTVCVLPAGHDLSARAEITVQDLYQQPLILLGKGRSFRRDIEQAFAQRNIPMQIRVETHTVGSACALVRGNIGIAIVNEMLARQYAGDALVLRPFRPDIRHQYAFVTSNHAPMTRITRQFLAHCRDLLGELLGDGGIKK